MKFKDRTLNSSMVQKIVQVQIDMCHGQAAKYHRISNISQKK